MKNILRILTWAVALACVPFLCWGEDDVRATIIAAQDFYYNNSIDRAEITLSSLPDELSPYWTVRRQYLKGLIALRREDEDGAKVFFEEMERTVDAEFSSRDRAEGLAFVAEARSRLLLLNGIAYKISNASKTLKIAESALQEDPANVLAQLVLARARIGAPKLFGGDVEYGIRTLESLLENNDTLEKGERFKALQALAQGWFKKKEYEKAARYARSALSLYPANPEAFEMVQEIEARLR